MGFEECIEKSELHRGKILVNTIVRLGEMMCGKRSHTSETL